MGIRQHGKRSNAIQVPGQLTDNRNSTLTIKKIFFDIETKCQPSCRYCPNIFIAHFSILDADKRVEIGNKEKRLIARLFGEFDGSNDCAQQIPEVRTATA